MIIYVLGRNNMDYENMVVGLKALAEPNRLKIVDLLSCGTKCACDLLEHFDFFNQHFHTI